MREEVKFDQGVPIPPPRTGTTRLTAGLRTMKVGDSFWVDITAQQQLHRAAGRVGVKIVTRREGHGFRVWRVK